MKIRYLGHSSFYIAGDEKSVVTDPFDGIGYEMERVNADYCTVSHEHFDHNATDKVNAKKTITRAEDGFLAIDTYHDANLGKLRGKNTVFKFTVDGVTFCHLGDLGEYYSDVLCEEIGKVDVLFIPVGGNYTIDGKVAARFAQGLHAAITVPMHYKTPRSDIDISGAEDFLKRMPNVIRVGSEMELTKESLPCEPAVCVFDDDKF